VQLSSADDIDAFVDGVLQERRTAGVAAHG
jgi:hypothetical protein